MYCLYSYTPLGVAWVNKTVKLLKLLNTHIKSLHIKSNSPFAVPYSQWLEGCTSLLQLFLSVASSETRILYRCTVSQSIPLPFNSPSASRSLSLSTSLLLFLIETWSSLLHTWPKHLISLIFLTLSSIPLHKTSSDTVNFSRLFKLVPGLFFVIRNQIILFYFSSSYH